MTFREEACGARVRSNRSSPGELVRDVWVYAGSRERAGAVRAGLPELGYGARYLGPATRSSRRRPTAPRSAGRCSPSSCSARTRRRGTTSSTGCMRARSCRTSACCSSRRPSSSQLRRARGRRRADRRAVHARRARGARGARDATGRSRPRARRRSAPARSSSTRPPTRSPSTAIPSASPTWSTSCCASSMSHPNRVFSREALLHRVWGYDYFGGARTVDVHIRRVRAKLGERARRAHQDGAERRLPVRAAGGARRRRGCAASSDPVA